MKNTTCLHSEGDGRPGWSVLGEMMILEGSKKAFLEEEKYGVVRADSAFYGCAEAKVFIGVEGCGS